MSTPLSFCDISARYGQMPAPQKTLTEQTGWDFNQLFLDYMRKVQAKHEEDREDAEEDALMAVIDAMNAPKDRRPNEDAVAVQSLTKAGKAISEEHRGKADPTQFPSVQAILAMLGDRFTFEQVDEVQENHEKVQELETEEEDRLEVTEARELSGPSDPDNNKKEV